MMHEGPPRSDQSQPLESLSGGLEAIDLQILSLLSQRFGLAASTTVQRELSDDERKAQMAVIRRRALELGIPVELVTDFWDRLMDAADAVQAQRNHRVIND